MAALTFLKAELIYTGAELDKLFLGREIDQLGGIAKEIGMVRVTRCGRNEEQSSSHNERT
jgi:hypothetical protein